LLRPPARALASVHAARASAVAAGFLLHHFWKPAATDIAVGVSHLITARRPSNAVDLGLTRATVCDFLDDVIESIATVVHH
jgi:hypothetical protein